MIDRRTFLSTAALSVSGTYLFQSATFAATETSGSGRRLVKNATRSIRTEGRYLNLPVKTGAAKRRLRVLLDSNIEREFYIELAEGAPDWWAFMDLTPFRGKRITLEVDELPEGSSVLNLIQQSDRIEGLADVYHETRRPQFHFSSRRGWLNDPNGLVFHQGEYHLFYQHNPYGWDWGNMHWGHAVSNDLVRWTELPIALYPDEHGTMFSGSAVIDEHDTAGFQSGAEKTMVSIFTAAPLGDERSSEVQPTADPPQLTQCIAFSNDRGRTWTKYKNNPVLPHLMGGNRDPNVIWFEPGKKWVMALYMDKRGSADFSVLEDSGYALFSSKDLKKWEKLCDVTLHGDGECPNFFEIALEDKVTKTRWIFYGAAGRYLIGSFDGQVFVAESGPHVLHHGNCFYASQTFNHIPASDGRRILIPWGQATAGTGMEEKPTGKVPLYQGMPFNQMMGIPVEIRLRTTEVGLQLIALPVKELQSLRSTSHVIEPQTLDPGNNPLKGVQGELLDITAQLAVDDAKEIGFALRGVKLSYDAQRQELSCLDRKAPLQAQGGRIRLRLLVDRTSVDIFGNDGRLYMPMGMSIVADNRSLEIYAKGGSAHIESLEVFELKSAWT